MRSEAKRDTEPNPSLPRGGLAGSPSQPLAEMWGPQNPVTPTRSSEIAPFATPGAIAPANGYRVDPLMTTRRA
jgi:hypothetical protein